MIHDDAAADSIAGPVLFDPITKTGDDLCFGAGGVDCPGTRVDLARDSQVWVFLPPDTDVNDGLGSKDGGGTKLKGIGPHPEVRFDVHSETVEELPSNPTIGLPRDRAGISRVVNEAIAIEITAEADFRSTPALRRGIRIPGRGIEGDRQGTNDAGGG
jgi:hypothetical protein